MVIQLLNSGKLKWHMVSSKSSLSLINRDSIANKYIRKTSTMVHYIVLRRSESSLQSLRETVET